jgi:hypothetical protein
VLFHPLTSFLHLSGNKTYALGNAASVAVKALFDAKPDVNKFVSFASIDRLFNREAELESEKQSKPFITLKTSLDHSLRDVHAFRCCS